MDEQYPIWLDQDFLGLDDEGNPIIWDIDTWQFWMGDDDEGKPIIIELPGATPH